MAVLLDAAFGELADQYSLVERACTSRAALLARGKRAEDQRERKTPHFENKNRASEPSPPRPAAKSVEDRRKSRPQFQTTPSVAGVATRRAGQASIQINAPRIGESQHTSI